MSYVLPFGSSAKLVEFGGGDNPAIRPNIDARAGLKTDIVANLEDNLPLETGAYDGVYCSYALEHLSWRKAPNLIREAARILRPGGTAVFVTANLLEQARVLAQRDDWTESDVCMVFGDQDYPENTHRAGFSPETACQRFREAGFEDVVVVPHPNCATDMIVEARKVVGAAVSGWTRAERSRAYNREYFDGARGGFGGYAREGYWDYPVHWVTFREIMKREPTSVLEIGSARGYVLKRIEDVGVRVKGLEISEHCFHTRVVQDIMTWDITETPWPIRDKEFDLCFSNAVLEHIPEDKIEDIALEMERTCKRGLHGISFEDDDFDKTHTTLHGPSWWSERLPRFHEIVDKESLEQGPVDPPGPDGLTKINVGSFTTMFHHGWTNMDVHALDGWANPYGYIYRQHDVRQGLPYAPASVDMIYGCHFLEHLTYQEGLGFLRESKRVMRPGAILRLIFPDAGMLTRKFLDGSLGQYDEVNEGCARSHSQAEKLWSLLFSGHNSTYDWNAIETVLGEAGFTRIQRMGFRKSGSPTMLAQTLDMFPTLSLYVEAIR